MILIQFFSMVMSPPVAALLLNYALMAGFGIFLYLIGLHLRCERPYMAMLIVIGASFPTAFFTSTACGGLLLFLMMGFVCHVLIVRSKAYLFCIALLPLAGCSVAFLVQRYLVAHFSVNTWAD